MSNRRQFLQASVSAAASVTARTTAWATAASALGAGLSGCAVPAAWPGAADGPSAQPATERLRQSAVAHGLAALPALRDINIGFDGDWAPLINRIQPALVDEAYRKSSQERLMLAQGVFAQAHEGPGGRKQVLRRWRDGEPGTVDIWYGGQASADVLLREAAATVADAYRIFVLGPMVLVDRALDVQWGAQAEVSGRVCDTLHLQLRPGLGLGEGDRLAVYIDRRLDLMRAVRFTINSVSTGAGAVVEVELDAHLSRYGIQWPTHYVERLVRPFPLLPVHDWRLVGLDVNRGYSVDELTGPALGPLAARPAEPLNPTRRAAT